MENFKDVLLDLDPVDDIARIELFYADGEEAGVLMNKPGSADAEDHPGKHPNIDRLFQVIEDKDPMTVNIIKV